MSLHPDELEILRENETLGKSFFELRGEGFYFNLTDSHINSLWYLSFSPDKQQIFAESSHQPPLTYLLPKDRSKFERDFLGFLKIDLSKILNLPNDVPMYQKAQDFIKLKLEQLT